MKQAEFGPTQRLQREYEKAIKKLITSALPPRDPEQTLEAWLQKVAEVSQRPDVRAASAELAGRMISWVNVTNARTWRQAANAAQRSTRLFQLLSTETRGAVGSRITQLIRENAKYISSIPAYAAYHLTDEVRTAHSQGARAETVAKMIRNRFPALLKSRVNVISRTETSKASTVLTQARCDDLNIQFYIWRTSEDVRVRDSHRRMDGVVIPWATPPAPELLFGEPSGLGKYHAGACPNCRCTPIVVLTLEDIRFPAKVYWNGAIVRMLKQQFLAQFHLESRAA